MSETRDGMTIGALARAAEVGVETVRYYQRRGLINEPERPYGGIRRYCEPDLRRLRFIRHARDLGFSLVEAGELLQLDDGVECEQAQRIAGENGPGSSSASSISSASRRRLIRYSNSVATEKRPGAQ